MRCFSYELLLVLSKFVIFKAVAFLKPIFLLVLEKSGILEFDGGVYGIA